MIETDTTGFLRHLRSCNNAVLPGERLPFCLGEVAVGWVRPALARALATFSEITVEGGPIALGDDATLPGDRTALPDTAVLTGGQIVLHDAAALPGIARRLSDQGHYRWRNEAFDVRATPDGPALAQIDRGALPSFGVAAVGVHVNGLVRRADGLHVWIARRAADKLLDPGKLDHITAGGVPAGLTPEQTLIKEAEEEAAIPAALARQARRVATLKYAMERAEGLRRDLLHCYDLDLPEDFTPRAADGEVESFELWPIARVFEAVRDTDAFKFNVNLVLIDLFQRRGLIPDGAAASLRVGINADRP